MQTGVVILPYLYGKEFLVDIHALNQISNIWAYKQLIRILNFVPKHTIICFGTQIYGIQE